MDRIKKNFLIAYVISHPVESIIVALSIFYVVYKISVFGSIPLEEYPYLHQDLWRRLSDAKFYLGQANTPFMHPPLPSLLYIPFLAIGGSFMYLINTFGFVLQFVAYYLLATKISSDKKIGAGAALLFFANYYNHHNFDFYGLVDALCASLILMSVYLWYQGKEKHSLMTLSGVFMGLAGLTQYAGVFVGPALVFAEFLEKKSFKEWLLNWKRYLMAAIPAFLLFTSFFLYRYVKFGSFVYSAVEHFGFLTITLKGLVFYFAAFLGAWSIPIIILAIIAIYLLFVNDKALLRKILLISIVFVPYFVFFTFFYGWQDVRFIMYYSFPIYLLAGVSISRFWSQTEQGPNAVELKFLGVVLLGALFYYLNLSANGYLGVIVGEQKMIRIEKGVLSWKQLPVKLHPYFSTLREFQNDKSGNEELQYFSKNVSPLRVMPIVTELQKRRQTGQKILLYLKNEPFVTSQQLSFYLGEMYQFEFYNTDEIKRNADSGEFDWLISDSDLSTFSNMNELVVEREGLKIYRKR